MREERERARGRNKQGDRERTPLTQLPRVSQKTHFADVVVSRGGVVSMSRWVSNGQGSMRQHLGPNKKPR